MKVIGMATGGSGVVALAAWSPLMLTVIIGVLLTLLVLVLASPWSTPFDRVKQLLQLWLGRPEPPRPRRRRRRGRRRGQ